MVYHLLRSDKSFRSNCKNNACKIEKSRNLNHLYSKLLTNGKKSAKMINMKKLRLIYSFLMPYYLHPSDKLFENAKQKTVRKIENPRNRCLSYLKLLLNHPEFQKILKINKFRNFITNPTVYHMHHFDKRYKNCYKNTLRKYK
jgi:hypothetical protein